MRTVFEHQVSLRWRDVDALGHVNHAVFLTYLEEGRDAFEARVVTVLWDTSTRKPMAFAAGDHARLATHCPHPPAP